MGYLLTSYPHSLCTPTPSSLARLQIPKDLEGSLPGSPTWNHSAILSGSLDGQLSPTVQKQGRLDLLLPWHGKSVKVQEGAPKAWPGIKLGADCRQPWFLQGATAPLKFSAVTSFPTPYLLDHPAQKATANVYFPTNINCPPGGIVSG